jgi:diguanylate cyclase (GGDEF)-like protein
MQDDADLETAPFERIAPTFGFYTYGEFFGASRLTLLNSTMVAVGMREGPRRLQPPGDGTRTADPAKALPALDPYANKHARVVSRLVRFIDAVTSELETSNREVTKLSLTDQLTQLVNRNRLDQVIDEQIRLASRYGIGFSVILLDIDHFKQVNDTYGHLAGDRVLVRVAEILLHNLRSVDVAGRWGGEEFLIVVPNSRREDALLLAEKLRAAIGDATFPVPGRRTGSFGVASYTGGDDPGALIARADAALYLAKHAGRNRVEPG